MNIIGDIIKIKENHPNVIFVLFKGSRGASKTVESESSNKNKMLSKIQPDWSLSTLKEESPNNTTPAHSQSYSRNSTLVDDKDLFMHGYSTTALRLMNSSRYCWSRLVSSNI